MKSEAVMIDEFLSQLDADKRKALDKLRKTIKGIVPGADECISYRMPAFRYEGRMLVWFGAGANHCAFYPGGIVEHYKDELKDFKTGKGTIQFQPNHPIPAALIKRIVKDRIEENRKRANRKKK